MDTYVITIGRELGSGGKHIGQLMADRLGIPVYDRRLITLAAQESGLAPETIAKADEKGSKGRMSQLIRALTSPYSTFMNIYNNSISNENLFKLQSDVIRQKAGTENCIIVGRCSDYVLRDHPRHLNIFVRADYADRLRFLQERYQIDAAQAKELIERTDSIRSDYHNLYCETNWGDSRAYDICVNSSLLGLDGTAELLLHFVRRALHIQ